MVLCFQSGSGVASGVTFVDAEHVDFTVYSGTNQELGQDFWVFSGSGLGSGFGESGSGSGSVSEVSFLGFEISASGQTQEPSGVLLWGSGSGSWSGSGSGLGSGSGWSGEAAVTLPSVTESPAPVALFAPPPEEKPTNQLPPGVSNHTGLFPENAPSIHNTS